MNGSAILFLPIFIFTVYAQICVCVFFLVALLCVCRMWVCVICIEFVGFPWIDAGLFSRISRTLSALLWLRLSLNLIRICAVHHKNINIVWIHMNVIYLITAFFTAALLYAACILSHIGRPFSRSLSGSVSLTMTSTACFLALVRCSFNAVISMPAALSFLKMVLHFLFNSSSVRLHFATCSFRVIAMSFICIIDIFCLLKKLFSGSKAAMQQFLTMPFAAFASRYCFVLGCALHGSRAPNPLLFVDGKIPMQSHCTHSHSSLQLDYWFWSSVKRHPVQQILCISVCWLIGIQIGNIHVVQCGRRYFVGFTPKTFSTQNACLQIMPMPFSWNWIGQIGIFVTEFRRWLMFTQTHCIIRLIYTKRNNNYRCLVFMWPKSCLLPMMANAFMIWDAPRNKVNANYAYILPI